MKENGFLDSTLIILILSIFSYTVIVLVGGLVEIIGRQLGSSVSVETKFKVKVKMFC